MKRMTSAILALALGLSLVSASMAGPGDAVDQAQRLLDLSDARAAVRLLEETLSDPGDQRPRIVTLLKKSYELAATQAEAAGRKAEAASYREDLAILSRAKKLPRPSIAPPAPKPAEPPAPLPVEAPITAAPTPHIQPIPNTPIEAVGAAPRTDILDEPAVVPPAAAASPTVADGDAAFRDKNYAEAGRIYTKLATSSQLPEGRNDHWAYCRWWAVVQKINAKPQTTAEWDAIDAEIEQIRKLSPKNFFGEYLKQRAATRIPGTGKAVTQTPPSKNEKVVIRGQTPEDLPPPAPVRKPTETRPQPLPQQAPTSPPSATWKIRETANFRIFHYDDGLADQVARVAEDIRDEQTRRWSGSNGSTRWTPACEIYLHPTADAFTEKTRQPRESPGFSTMDFKDGRIVTRVIQLRVDARGLVPAVLPHEVTHVVLADLFSSQQIPRWADEGMAVLSEPLTEQGLRANDLDGPLKTGRLFKMSDLMVMDYPDGEYWSLYYAQSVSLTRFLVERGTPQKFVQFLQASQRNGVEVELQRSYGFKNCQDLQDQWLTQMRSSTNVLTANGRPNGSETTRD